MTIIFTKTKKTIYFIKNNQKQTIIGSSNRPNCKWNSHQYPITNSSYVSTPYSSLLAYCNIFLSFIL